MKSRTPKVLHPICGRPMVAHVAEAARRSGVEQTAVVVGHGAEQVRSALGDGFLYVEQREQLGSGHALLQARATLEGKASRLLVLNGDVPLVQPETLQAMMDAHTRRGAAMTLLACADCPADGLGRVDRDPSGRVRGIIEAAELSEEQQGIREVNAGCYCFDAAWLWPALAELRPSKGGEVYLTGLCGLAHGAGRPIEAVSTRDPLEALGVDTRIRLAQAEAAMRQRIRERWMLEGVTLLDPPSIFIDATVEIGQDTVIHPHTTIAGESSIAEECQIGPGAIISSSRIGRGCRVLASVIEGSVLEDGIDVGPYSHLRPESYVEAGAHIGNFVEVKKSRLGRGTKVGHFSYLGDATLGKNVNVGAGTITCNFDGERKLPTIVEDDAFLGCDSMLVAPVRVGARARTGAGAVVTRDVPPDTTVVGMPARPLTKGSRRGKAARP